MAEVSVNTATMPASAAIATNVVTRDGLTEHVQLISLFDTNSGNTFTIGASGIAFYQPQQSGVWSYQSGSAGTVTVSGRVLSLAAHSTAGGYFTINGGSQIPIIANTSYSLQPLGNLINATFVFSLTDSFFIEILN